MSNRAADPEQASTSSAPAADDVKQTVETLAGFVIVCDADDAWLTVNALADHQKGRFNRCQLLACGLSSDQIQRAAKRGRLRRCAHGVYALGHLATIEHTREIEALLAIGTDAVLFGLSVLEFHGLITPRKDEPLHVATRTNRRLRKRATVRLHYASDLGRIEANDRIPMTTVERALADAAPFLTARELEQAVDEAVYRRLTSRTKVRELAERRGMLDLEALASPDRPSARTESPPQELMLALIREAGLPEPETEVELWGYRADFLFRDAGVVVEVDPFRTHGEVRKNFNRDRRKDRVFAAHGLEVMRVSDDDLNQRRLEIIAQLAASIARRLAERARRAA